MIRFPAGYDSINRIKRYQDYYQASYGVMLLSAGQFSPLSLFAAGEQGAWYDPSDFSTMFTDAAGTTPVTAVEQPVGLLLDKSKGLALGSETVINGDCSSSTGWISGGAGWTITGGQLVMTAAASSGIVYQQYSDGRLTAGKTYKVTFDIVSVSAGSARIDLWGATTANGVYFSTNGTKTCYIVAPSAPVGMQFTVSGPFTGTIDNISVRELPGNHASQSTAASRPVLSARVNLLTYTEQFDNAAWVNYQTSDAGNTTTAPDGTTTADTLTATAGTNARFIYQLAPAVVSGARYTVSFSAKAGTQGAVQFCSSDGFDVVGYVNFNLSTGAIGTSSIYTGSISSQGNGWYRCTVTLTATSAAAPNLVICMVADASATRAASWTAAGTETIFLWGADLRVTNVGVNLPAYQRVAAATDYDTSGFPLYLKFDGVDDSLATGTIDPGAVDKAQVFAGVRKLSDAARAMFAETGIDTTGAIRLEAPNAANNYIFTSCGSAGSPAAAVATGYSAPITNVVTGLGDIIADTTIIRINNTQIASSSTDQGTGNYLSYPLYIGRRGGSSLPYNGNLYSMILRFSAANLSDAQIASTETYVNSKTGAY